MTVGSALIFADGYIEKEENGKVWDVLMRWLGEKSSTQPLDKIIWNTL